MSASTDIPSPAAVCGMLIRWTTHLPRRHWHPELDRLGSGMIRSGLAALAILGFTALFVLERRWP